MDQNLLTTLITGTLTMVVLTSCGSSRSALDLEVVNRLSKLPYPEDAEYGPDLDIVIVRKRFTIDVANRTPRSYEQMQMWLNQQYVHPVEPITIGTKNTLSLKQFINHHGESYPTGSFLRPERSFPIVLAEFYDPEAGIRHRLIVQPH